MCIIYTLPSSHIPTFIKNACLVIKLSRDPDLSGQTDGRTDGQTEGKPIVPSGVNTGRGLINGEPKVKLNYREYVKKIEHIYEVLFTK